MDQNQENRSKQNNKNPKQEKVITAQQNPPENKSTQELSNAGFLIRLQAQIIDWLLNLSLILLIWYFIFVKLPLLEVVLPAVGIALYIQIFLLPAFIAFYVIFITSKFGGTIGKLVSGIKVIFEDGRLLTIKQSTFRYLVGYFVSGLLYGLGFLWIIKDPEKRGWHDHVSSTFVKTSNKSLRFIGTIILVIFFGLNIILLFTTIQSIKANKGLQSELLEIWKDFEDSALEIEEPPDTIKPINNDLII